MYTCLIEKLASWGNTQHLQAGFMKVQQPKKSKNSFLGVEPFPTPLELGTSTSENFFFRIDDRL
jgi:hypothetical protein